MARFLPLFLLVGAGCSTSDPKTHSASFGGDRIQSVTAARGERATVFVHCWGGNLTFWKEQVPALQDHARLLLIDLPGHGGSGKPDAAYPREFFADAVLAAMRDAGVGTATLVGHSMGVPVICEVYKKDPQRGAGLVAVDGFLRRPSIPADQADAIMAPLRTPEYREHAKTFVAMMFPEPGTEKLRDWVLENMLATPRHVLLGAMESMFGAGPGWAPAKGNLPIVVLNAPNPMWTAEYETWVRSLSSRVDIRTIDRVGHWLMLEKPAEFNAALLEALRRFELISK
jgi:pimeloyl-ACP methyl ester carboxylesterase